MDPIIYVAAAGLISAAALIGFAWLFLLNDRWEEAEAQRCHWSPKEL